MIDFSPIPDLHVHVTMGDVLCCNGCACCCSESSSDITFQKQGGGAIHVDPNTVYVLDTKGGGLNLRKKRPCEGWCCCGSKDLYRDTLAHFYDAQASTKTDVHGKTIHHSAERIALTAAWKKIDFVHLYQNRAYFTASHVWSLYDAIQAIKPISDELDHVIQLVMQCKPGAKMVALEIDDGKEGSGATSSAEQHRYEPSMTRADVSIGFSPLPGPTYSQRPYHTTHSIHDRSSAAAVHPKGAKVTEHALLLAEFKQVAARPEVGLDAHALEVIADKFAALISADHAGDSKKLADLASTRIIIPHITGEEAGKLLILANNIFRKKEELKRTATLSSQPNRLIHIPEIIHALALQREALSNNLPVNTGPMRTIMVQDKAAH